MGETNLDSLDLSGSLEIDNQRVLTNQQAHIPNASVAHALNATFSDTEAEAALNALGGKINDILTALRAHGLIASS